MFTTGRARRLVLVEERSAAAIVCFVFVFTTDRKQQVLVIVSTISIIAINRKQETVVGVSRIVFPSLLLLGLGFSRSGRGWLRATRRRAAARLFFLGLFFGFSRSGCGATRR